MEFWGVEVKAGKSLKVTPEMGKVIHISQAALGEVKEKANGLIPLRVNINDQKHVLGSLSTDTIPQVSFDLVFEKEFELSHGWKNGSVYFCGYSAEAPVDDDDISEFDDEEEDEDEDEDEETVPALVTENGKKEEAKAPANKGKDDKTKVAVEEPKKVESEESSDDEDEDDSDDDSDEEMLDSDDEDDSEDEKTPTPKKPASGKKRANDSATKTPVQAKKAKVETPQKTDGKKGSHTATPHPAKKADKSAGAKATQTPKSDSKVVCKSCSKTFNSEKGLESHTKAKHA